MKQLGKLINKWLAAAAVFGCCMAAAAAAEQQPQIILKASGIENQYILQLEDFSSRFESVQFDICIDRELPAPQISWQDDSPAHFQQVGVNQKDGKTVLTVYIDRLRPIANSGSTELAALTFSQALPASSFSAGNELIALDENQEETVFRSPLLTVKGAAGGGSSFVEDDSDSSDGGSQSSHFSESSRVLRWEDVSERITESSGKKLLTISVSKGQVIGPDIFRQAHKLGILLRLDYGDYIWTFDTAGELTIPSGRVFYDLSVKTLRYRNLSAAVDQSDLLQFEIAYSGPLPCKATLSCRVGSQYAGETVYLSLYNEKEAVLDYQESAEVGTDGMAGFTFTHASRYVISEKDLWETSVQGTALAAPGAASSISPVIVPPEEAVKAIEEAPSEEQEPEQEDSSSPPEELEVSAQPEMPDDTETEQSDIRWDAWIVPVLVLSLSAAAIVILLLYMRANRKGQRHG